MRKHTQEPMALQQRSHVSPKTYLRAPMIGHDEGDAERIVVLIILPGKYHKDVPVRYRLSAYSKLSRTNVNRNTPHRAKEKKKNNKDHKIMQYVWKIVTS